MSDQFIAISSVGSVLAFVHAKNNYVQCRTLWLDLLNIQDSTVCFMGDFNVVLGTFFRDADTWPPDCGLPEFYYD